MRYFLSATTAAFVLVFASAAWPFELDRDSNTNPDGSARFSDPDEMFETPPGGNSSSIYMFKSSDREASSTGSAPAASEPGVPWTSDRIRLVFGPYAHRDLAR
jgi:hypothetical protein